MNKFFKELQKRDFNFPNWGSGFALLTFICLELIACHGERALTKGKLLAFTEDIYPQLSFWHQPRLKLVDFGDEKGTANRFAPPPESSATGYVIPRDCHSLSPAEQNPVALLYRLGHQELFSWFWEN